MLVILGGNYPGAVSFGETEELAVLLEHREADPGFYRRLRRRMRALAARFRPERERQAWRRLLGEIS